MNSKYVPFADQGHIVYSDVKFSGHVQALCASVRFCSASEVDALIDSLRLLRDNLEHARGHFHLQDRMMAGGGQRGSEGYPAEIVFMNPAWYKEAGEADLRELAHREISACSSAKKKSV